MTRKKARGPRVRDNDVQESGDELGDSGQNDRTVSLEDLQQVPDHDQFLFVGQLGLVIEGGGRHLLLRTRHLATKPGVDSGPGRGARGATQGCDADAILTARCVVLLYESHAELAVGFRPVVLSALATLVPISTMSALLGHDWMGSGTESSECPSVKNDQKKKFIFPNAASSL